MGNISYSSDKKNVMVIILFSVLLSTFFPFCSCENSSSNNSSPTINQGIHELNFVEKKDSINLESIIFLVRFSDFSCSICFQEFVKFSELLTEKADTNKIKIKYIFERDDKDIKIQRRVLKRWLARNNIDLGFSLVTSLSPFNKSGIFLKNEVTYEYFNFPLGKNMFEQVEHKINNIILNYSTQVN